MTCRMSGSAFMTTNCASRRIPLPEKKAHELYELLYELLGNMDNQ